MAQVELETEAGLPEFVKEEFDAFLECGILAHGFLRLRCVDCAHEKLVAFSCKRRGFCPSCGARRMAERARPREGPVGRAEDARPPTWSITSFPGCQCANGCCRFRSRFVVSLPHIPTCSRPFCRSSTGSLADF
ncbi:MAG: transposase zinc-binding domain-containing protein [Gammaproteobacteria bacterium]